MRALGARRSDVMALYLARAAVVGAGPACSSALMLALTGALALDAGVHRWAADWLTATNQSFPCGPGRERVLHRPGFWSGCKRSSPVIM